MKFYLRILAFGLSISTIADSWCSDFPPQEGVVQEAEIISGVKIFFNPSTSLVLDNQVTHLKLSHNNFTDKDIKTLLRHIDHAPHLEALDLSYNALSNKSLNRIKLYIQKMPHLKELHIENNSGITCSQINDFFYDPPIHFTTPFLLSSTCSCVHRPQEPMILQQDPTLLEVIRFLESEKKDFFLKKNIKEPSNTPPITYNQIINLLVENNFSNDVLNLGNYEISFPMKTPSMTSLSQSTGPFFLQLSHLYNNIIFISNMIPLHSHDEKLQDYLKAKHNALEDDKAATAILPIPQHGNYKQINYKFYIVEKTSQKKEALLKKEDSPDSSKNESFKENSEEDGTKNSRKNQSNCDFFPKF